MEIARAIVQMHLITYFLWIWFINLLHALHMINSADTIGTIVFNNEQNKGVTFEWQGKGG